MIEAKPTGPKSLADENEVLPKETLFEDTLGLLSQTLLGDRFAAKFLLCSLVSSIYMRRAEVILGPITLNLNLKDTAGKASNKLILIMAIYPILRLPKRCLFNLRSSPGKLIQFHNEDDNTIIIFFFKTLFPFSYL